MSKWTPGPWIAIVPDRPCIYNGSDITNFSIHSTSAYHDAGRVDNKTIVSGEFMERIGHEESAANARLIAEAPAMAELLERIVNSDMAQMAEDEGRVCAELPDARALLARLEAE